MKKVITRDRATDTVFLDELNKSKPVFAKKEGKLYGMIVLEYDPSTMIKKSWILRIGKDLGAYGYSETLGECIQEGMRFGYEFFVED